MTTDPLQTALEAKLREYRGELLSRSEQVREFDQFLAELIEAGWTYSKIEKLTGIARPNVYRMVKRHRMRVGGEV